MKEEIPEVECSSNRCPQDGAIRFLKKRLILLVSQQITLASVLTAM